MAGLGVVASVWLLGCVVVLERGSVPTAGQMLAFIVAGLVLVAGLLLLRTAIVIWTTTPGDWAEVRRYRREHQKLRTLRDALSKTD